MSLLKQFLERTKQNLVKFQQTQQDHLQSQSVIHIVLGNEAADADSLISTLCYAFLKDLTRGDSAKRKGQGMDLDVLFIPASGVSRSDVPLRRDVQLAVSQSHSYWSRPYLSNKEYTTLSYLCLFLL